MANAESVPSPVTPAKAGPPKRKLRNFLLDKRFQLKYTGMVVVVTVAVAGFLGYFAYGYSVGQTEAMSIQIAMNPELAPEAANDLEEWARDQDRMVLMGIIGGILILTVALGFVGIIVTHKVVGPSYKIKRLLRDVAAGHLKVEGRLRKGDELQDVFEAFAEMVTALRGRQADEVAQLDRALKRAREAGVPDEALADVVAVRDSMQAQLD